MRFLKLADHCYHQKEETISIFMLLTPTNGKKTGKQNKTRTKLIWENFDVKVADSFLMNNLLWKLLINAVALPDQRW